MNLSDQEPPNESPEVNLRARDLWAVERFFMEEGTSELVYDAKLDVFRFAEDGRFAFCEEFADWTLLRERGHLIF
jgi:hypothetical protein